MIREKYNYETITELVNSVVKAVEEENKEYHQALKAIKSQIEDSNKEIANLVKAIARGENIDVFDLAIKERKQEIKKLEEEKEKLALSKPAIEKIDTKQLIEYLNSFEQVMQNGSNQEKREFIRTFIRKMEFNPSEESITIYWYADPVQTQNQSIDTMHTNKVWFSSGVGGGT